MLSVTLVVLKGHVSYKQGVGRLSTSRQRHLVSSHQNSLPQAAGEHKDKNVGSAVSVPGATPQTCGSCLAFLCLSFLLWEMGTITAVTS